MEDPRENPLTRGTSRTCENPGTTPPGLEPGSLGCKRLPLVHMLLDTSWITPAQSSPSALIADNQCAVDIAIFVHKTAESSLQLLTSESVRHVRRVGRASAFTGEYWSRVAVSSREDAAKVTSLIRLRKAVRLRVRRSIPEHEIARHPSSPGLQSLEFSPRRRNAKHARGAAYSALPLRISLKALHCEIWAALNSDILRADEGVWGEYGAAEILKGGGNGRSPRKPADKHHLLAQFPHAKIRERPGRGLSQPLVHTVYDNSWRTVAQSSPSTATVDYQCKVDICIFVHKTVESSPQVSELANFSGLYLCNTVSGDRAVRSLASRLALEKRGGRDACDTAFPSGPLQLFVALCILESHSVALQGQPCLRAPHLMGLTAAQVARAGRNCTCTTMRGAAARARHNSPFREGRGAAQRFVVARPAPLHRNCPRAGLFPLLTPAHSQPLNCTLVPLQRILTTGVLRTDEGEARVAWSRAGIKGGRNGRSLRKHARPTASSGTIPMCGNPGATPPGIELGSSLWESKAAVAERLACSPPAKSNRVQPSGGSLPDFASGGRAGRCSWSAGFLGDLTFPRSFIPALLHTHLTSPSSALKTSIFKTRSDVAVPLTWAYPFSDCMREALGTGLVPVWLLHGAKGSLSDELTSLLKDCSRSTPAPCGCLQKLKGERYRLNVVVSELRAAASVEYQTALVAFVNCLIISTPQLKDRIRIRNEFVEVVLQVINSVRLPHRHVAKRCEIGTYLLVEQNKLTLIQFWHKQVLFASRRTLSPPEGRRLCSPKVGCGADRCRLQFDTPLFYYMLFTVKSGGECQDWVMGPACLSPLPLSSVQTSPPGRATLTQRLCFVRRSQAAAGSRRPQVSVAVAVQLFASALVADWRFLFQP
ncbi:hypothetical protein PR048_004550 [Dryococelus australis]|uniref:Uncharacterized protein n=1 Tax=Dryococelus australis TaxID=614101 RepID=A0ABQ9I6R6_9NEOP|nr:hypothetical protein PR048_004550 [Dryococelus australis]